MLGVYLFVIMGLLTVFLGGLFLPRFAPDWRVRADDGEDNTAIILFALWWITLPILFLTLAGWAIRSVWMFGQNLGDY